MTGDHRLHCIYGGIDVRVSYQSAALCGQCSVKKTNWRPFCRASGRRSRRRRQRTPAIPNRTAARQENSSIIRDELSAGDFPSNTAHQNVTYQRMQNHCRCHCHRHCEEETCPLTEAPVPVCEYTCTCIIEYYHSIQIKLNHPQIVFICVIY